MAFHLSDTVVCITGAGSGIGRATALAFAERRAVVALADRDAAGLAETRALVTTAGGRASEHVLDVGDEAAVHAFASDVVRTHGRADVLVNNAGVALFGTVSELDTGEMAWLMQVNFWGTVYGVQAFLPALLAQPQAAIVNISSVFGLFGPPGQSAYAASKFAIRGFSESLRAELAGTRVSVTTVHPGGINTAIARSARVARAANAEQAAKMTAKFEQAFLTTTPEVVAAAILGAVELGRERVIVGSGARLIDTLTRLLPTRAGAILAKRR